MDGIAILIKNGHKEEEIPEYYLDVFKLYLLAAIRVEKKERAAYVIDTANAVAALFSEKGSNPLKDYVEGLLEDNG